MLIMMSWLRRRIKSSKTGENYHLKGDNCWQIAQAENQPSQSKTKIYQLFYKHEDMIKFQLQIKANI